MCISKAEILKKKKAKCPCAKQNIQLRVCLVPKQNSSHRMFGHMHRVLNIEKTITQFATKL